MTSECATSENLNIWSMSFANPKYSRYVHGVRDTSHRQLVHPDHSVPTIRLRWASFGHTPRTLSIGNVQRSLIRHGNGASSWFRRAAEPELITQTEPQKLRRHTTCGHRGRVAFSDSKTETSACGSCAGRDSSHASLNRRYCLRATLHKRNIRTHDETCDNAQKLITGSTHDMQSNFSRVMRIKKTHTHTPGDLQLCWRRDPRCPTCA